MRGIVALFKSIVTLGCPEIGVKLVIYILRENIKLDKTQQRIKLCYMKI